MSTAVSSQESVQKLYAAVRLKDLDFYLSFGLSELAWGEILESTHALKKIRLRYCLVGDAVLSRVIETAVEQHIWLEKVGVSGNWCGNLSLGAIANCVQRSKLSKRLAIEDLNNFGSVENASVDRFFKERDFTILADAVKKGHSLANFAYFLPVTLWTSRGSSQCPAKMPHYLEVLELSSDYRCNLDFQK
jgi:hypothetical protein